MDLEIKKGINNKQIDQLIEYSAKDESVAKFTSDRERFESRQAFDEWQKGGKEIFTLANKNGDLMGIIWLGLKEMPQAEWREKIDKDSYKLSFAIRIYGEARGKGLALDFMKKCIKNKGIWLATSDDNLAAKALYSKFGFRQVSDPSEDNKIVMIY